VTSAVDRVAGSLQCISNNRVIDLLRLNTGRRKRAARRNCAKIDSGYILQHAHVLTHRRALTTQYENVFTHTVKPNISRKKAQKRKSGGLIVSCLNLYPIFFFVPFVPFAANF